jgi:hypothetical protein
MNGDFVACSAELFSIQLVDTQGSTIDPELIRHAAAAVLHYFKHDLERQSVTVAEFANALEQVLQAVGLKLSSAAAQSSSKMETADLGVLASHCGGGFELAFFPTIRQELSARLARAPSVLRFQGLNECVKELLGAKRWSGRCQALHDQIVDYLRDCLETEAPGSSCRLVVF